LNLLRACTEKQIAYVDVADDIPAMPPSLATQMILQGEITHRGIVPLPDWLSRERFVAAIDEAAFDAGSEN
jgi:saccharopine dehydrogenase-like NADP-dependent oxidoreductase